MNLNLSRKKLLWIGIGLISFYYLLNKFEFIFNSSTTEGIVIGYDNTGSLSSSTIQFEVQHQFYYFDGQKNVEYSSREKLPVIYLKNNPDQAYVFSFLGFWYTGLIVCLVPLMLWCAFVLSFYKADDIISLSFFRKKSTAKEEEIPLKKQAESKSIT